MNKLYIPKFNIHTTLIGGQSFAWSYDGEYYWGITSTRIMQVRYTQNYLEWQTYPVLNDELFIKSYFRADINYDIIHHELFKDSYVKEANDHVGNLIILKQDFNQTLISFLISSNNSIKSIRTRLSKFTQAFEKTVKVDDKIFYLFPTIEEISSKSHEDLSGLSLGYRSEYVENAVKTLKKGDVTQQILENNEEKARQYLLSLKGVGEKVADCVMVFGLGYDDIMPFDRWGRRIASDLYGHDINAKYHDLRTWAKSKYGGYASWASQYLFEWYRNR